MRPGHRLPAQPQRALPLLHYAKGLQGRLRRRRLRESMGIRKAPPSRVPAPIPNQSAPPPIPGFIPSPHRLTTELWSLFHFEHTPRPRTVQATNPRLAPARAPPTRGDDNGDWCALTVPNQGGHSHRVADSTFEAPYFCGVRVSWEYLLSRGATWPGQHKATVRVRGG